MWGRWWGLLVCVALGLPAAYAVRSVASSSAIGASVNGDSTLASFLTSVSACESTAVTSPANDTNPDDDADSRDLDDDDDPDDDALPSGLFAVELPRESRIVYGAATATFHVAPDIDELLRPPQLRVD